MEKEKDHLNIFLSRTSVMCRKHTQINFFQKNDVGIWGKYLLKVQKVYENKLYIWPGIVELSLANIENYINSSWSFIVLVC